jgi:hypothetical protein
MAADRVEGNDLAARRPDLVRTLARAWDEWAARANVDPWTGPPRLPWGDDAPPASASRTGALLLAVELLQQRLQLALARQEVPLPRAALLPDAGH